MRNFKSLLSERDKVGAQLVKQNEKIVSLEDTIQLQTSMLRVSKAVSVASD